MTIAEDEEIYQLVQEQLVFTQGRVVKAMEIVAADVKTPVGRIQTAYYRHRKKNPIVPPSPLKAVMDKLELLEALLNELLERSDNDPA